MLELELILRRNQEKQQQNNDENLGHRNVIVPIVNFSLALPSILYPEWSQFSPWRKYYQILREPGMQIHFVQIL